MYPTGEHIIFTHQDLIALAARLGSRMTVSIQGDKAYIQGSMRREEYILDHVSDPTPDCPWGESYYRRL